MNRVMVFNRVFLNFYSVLTYEMWTRQMVPSLKLIDVCYAKCLAYETLHINLFKRRLVVPVWLLLRTLFSHIGFYGLFFAIILASIHAVEWQRGPGPRPVSGIGLLIDHTENEQLVVAATASSVTDRRIAVWVVSSVYCRNKIRWIIVTYHGPITLIILLADR